MNQRRRLLVAGGLASIATTSLTTRRDAYSPSTRMRTVGGIWGDGPEGDVTAAAFKSFKAALAQRGYVEGNNLSIDSQFAHGLFDRFPSIADGLVQRRVDVLVSTGTPG